MKKTIGASGSLALLLLLAACATPGGVPDVAVNGTQCGPCCDRDPAAEAAATQGVSAANPANPYTGKDAYANVVVAAGTVLYALTPGEPPGFAVTERTLRDAQGDWRRYYALVQVTTDPGVDETGAPRRLREQVRAFRAPEALCAARGTARANPQFGPGGGTQYYVLRADAARLVPGAITPLSHWHP